MDGGPAPRTLVRGTQRTGANGWENNQGPATSRWQSVFGKFVAPLSTTTSSSSTTPPTSEAADDNSRMVDDSSSNQGRTPQHKPRRRVCFCAAHFTDDVVADIHTHARPPEIQLVSFLQGATHRQIYCTYLHEEHGLCFPVLPTTKAGILPTLEDVAAWCQSVISVRINTRDFVDVRNMLWNKLRSRRQSSFADQTTPTKTTPTKRGRVAKKSPEKQEPSPTCVWIGDSLFAVRKSRNHRACHFVSFNALQSSSDYSWDADDYLARPFWCYQHAEEFERYAYDHFVTHVHLSDTDSQVHSASKSGRKWTLPMPMCRSVRVQAKD